LQTELQEKKLTLKKKAPIQKYSYYNFCYNSASRIKEFSSMFKNTIVLLLSLPAMPPAAQKVTYEHKCMPNGYWLMNGPGTIIILDYVQKGKKRQSIMRMDDTKTVILKSFLTISKNYLRPKLNR
jgi:hypothetical protein